MAKDPAFPFYAQDYLVDTIRWTRAMQGLHVSLMAESWANGGIPDDDGKPAGLGSTDVEPWFKIKHKWVLVDGMWTSPKLEEVRAEREAFRQKQREKGLLSGKKRNHSSTKQQPKMNSGSTTVEPIEDEDESEDEIVIKSKLQIFELLFSDERFVENIRMAHRGKDIKQAFEECYTHHSNAPNPPLYLWQWRQKLNTWLANTYAKPNTKNSKQSSRDLAEALDQRMREDAAVRQS